MAGGKRVRKWEKRWVLQPNVLDLNDGDIWVQKWVTVESAKESKEAIEKIIKDIEETEKQEALAQTQRAKISAELPPLDPLETLKEVADEPKVIETGAAQ